MPTPFPIARRISDADSLRAAQAPLKERYRQAPDAATGQLEARAGFTDEGVTCTVETWAGPVRAGLHETTGGDGTDACSGDMLLQALLACAGVTLRSVATAMSVDVRSAALTATATFDARGTLGVSREVPVGISGAHVEAVLDTDADDATLERLAEVAERYCVVGQSLKDPVTFTVRRP